jgi:hypothetical protein
MSWERLGRLTSNAGGTTRFPTPDVGGASSGPCSCRDSGQPNGLCFGCAGQGPSKVRDVGKGSVVPVLN